MLILIPLLLAANVLGFADVPVDTPAHRCVPTLLPTEFKHDFTITSYQKGSAKFRAEWLAARRPGPGWVELYYFNITAYTIEMKQLIDAEHSWLQNVCVMQLGTR
jgi:hypothetical protein